MLALLTTLPLCVVSVEGYGGWVAVLLFFYVVAYAMMVKTWTDLLYALVCATAILAVGVVLDFILLADTSTVEARKPGKGMPQMDLQ